MVNKLKEWGEYLLLLFLFFSAVFLAFYKNLKGAILGGVKLFFATVFPALFPYFFLINVISNLNATKKISRILSPLTEKMFRLSGISGYAFILSTISGYPVGAKIVSDLKRNNLIGEKESVKASILCSTSSPIFLISSVGSIMFKSVRFGILLFISQFISAIILGFIFSFYGRDEKPKNSRILPLNCDNLLYDSVYSAVISVLFVGGIITLFYLLTDILVYYNLLSPAISLLKSMGIDGTIGEGIALSFFETTKGLLKIATAPTSLFTLPTVCAICGFGGLSIIFQSVAHLKSAKIKTTLFIFSKILSVAINFVVGLILSVLFLV